MDTEKFRYGGKLVKVCSAFEYAKSELMESTLRIRTISTRQNALIRVRDIVLSFGEDHLQIQHTILEFLAGKLNWNLAGSNMS
jgi:hypothetical protein